MKKWFLSIMAVGMLALTACSQNILPADRGFSSAPVINTSERVSAKDLGAVRSEVYKTFTLNYLNDGYKYAKVKWANKDGTVVGFDNIYPSNSPDRINLGSDDGIVIEVVEAK